MSTLFVSSFYTGGPRNGQMKDKRDWDDEKWLRRASRIERLPQMMRDNRLSQSALARKIGVNQSTVNRWVHGKTCPHKQALRDLANLWYHVYGYSLDV